MRLSWRRRDWATSNGTPTDLWTRHRRSDLRRIGRRIRSSACGCRYSDRRDHAHDRDHRQPRSGTRRIPTVDDSISNRDGTACDAGGSAARDLSHDPVRGGNARVSIRLEGSNTVAAEGVSGGRCHVVPTISSCYRLRERDGIVRLQHGSGGPPDCDDHDISAPHFAARFGTLSEDGSDQCAIVDIALVERRHQIELPQHLDGVRCSETFQHWSL